MSAGSSWKEVVNMQPKFACLFGYFMLTAVSACKKLIQGNKTILMVFFFFTCACTHTHRGDFFKILILENTNSFTGQN